MTNIFCYTLFVWSGVRTDSLICVNYFFVASLQKPCQFCSREVSQGFDMLHVAYLIMITMSAGLNIKNPFFQLLKQRDKAEKKYKLFESIQM